MEIQKGKAYRTRDGREAIILEVGLKLDGGRSVVVLVPKGQDGLNHILTCYSNGRYLPHGKGAEHMLDILPAPDTVTGWVNVYRKVDGGYIFGYACPDEKYCRREANQDDESYCGTLPFNLVIPSKEDQ